MWRKATCYKSATFAALVVGSSLALLTGAQADNFDINLGAAASGTVTFTNPGNSPTNLSMSFFPAVGPRPGTSPFTWMGLSGTYNFTSGSQPSVSGFNGTSFTNIGPNNAPLFLNLSNGDLLSGQVAFGGPRAPEGQLVDNHPLNSGLDQLIGTLDVSAPPLCGLFCSSGAFSQLSTFPITLNLLGTSSSTLADLLGTGGSAVMTVTGGTIGSPLTTPNEIPVPAALPLFASGLGALGLLGWRRKRRAQAVA
jgi:hypothetical protein